MYKCSNKLAAKMCFSIKKRKSGCWEWTGYTNNNGYGVVRDYGRGNQLVHRAMYAWYNGEFDPEKWVLHTCDNRKCCNPKHLYLGTAVENAKDRDTRQRTFVKLTADDVIQVRKRHSEGESQSSIARSFGVSQPQICGIVNGYKRKSV